MNDDHQCDFLAPTCLRALLLLIVRHLNDSAHLNYSLVDSCIYVALKVISLKIPSHITFCFCESFSHNIGIHLLALILFVKWDLFLFR